MIACDIIQYSPFIWPYNIEHTTKYPTRFRPLSSHYNKVMTFISKSVNLNHWSQSCYESPLLETRKITTLRLTLPCSKTVSPLDSNTKFHYSEEISKKTDSCGGWSFLQALSNVCHGNNKESNYVHPQSKRSSLILCEKTLQLCNENLGNEMGTDFVENNIDLCSSSSSENNIDSAGDSLTREKIKAVHSVFGGKRNRTRDF